MWVEFNNNPVGRKVGDCAVRAVSKALDMGWEAAYIALVINGIQMADLPNSDVVSGATLRQHGFKRKTIENTCPVCYTVEDFCNDNPKGIYVLYCGGHVVTVIDGSYYDAWDSGKEVPQFVWYKEDKKA